MKNSIHFTNLLLISLISQLIFTQVDPNTAMKVSIDRYSKITLQNIV